MARNFLCDVPGNSESAELRKEFCPTLDLSYAKLCQIVIITRNKATCHTELLHVISNEIIQNDKNGIF